MSPNLYIAYFLICVEWSICYEYYDRNLNNKPEIKKNVKVKHNTERNVQLGKDPNAPFDLAGFLNLDDEAAAGNGAVDFDGKSGHQAKEYIDYGSIIDESVENINKRDDSHNLAVYNQAKPNINPLDFNSLGNDRQFNMLGLNIHEKTLPGREYKAVNTIFHDEPLPDSSLVHNPEKKCSFRKMKFPFFSLNKSQTTKKAKKRKMFCLNCKKDSAATTSTVRPYEMSKIKRSYVERLCPECQKRFRMEIGEDQDDEKRKLNQRMIHNSRQYFAELDNLAKAKFEIENVLKNKGEESTKDVAVSVENGRRKRDDYDGRDRLKELDLIQKKVDSVKIFMPHFDKVVGI